MFLADIEVAVKLVKPLVHSPYQISVLSSLELLVEQIMKHKLTRDDLLYSNIIQMVEGTNSTMWLFDDQEDRVTLYLKCIVESTRFLGRKFDHAHEHVNVADRDNDRVQSERLWNLIDELKLLDNKN